MRTPEEIQRQIDGLLSMKSWLPEHSMFGDDNWRLIDEQIQILKGEADFEEIEDAYIDEGEETPSTLWDAEGWLEGQIDDDLFESRD